jgi:hypothetical protein
MNHAVISIPWWSCRVQGYRIVRAVSPPLSPLRPDRSVKDAVENVRAPEPVELATDGFDIEGLASATPTNYQACALLLYNESPTRIVSIIRGLGNERFVHPTAKCVPPNSKRPSREKTTGRSSLSPRRLCLLYIPPPPPPLPQVCCDHTNISFSPK